MAPTFKETDIVGFLRLAGELLARADAERKVVILLTDARHYVAKELDLETRANVKGSLELVAKGSMFAPLHGVEVAVVGAGDRAGARGTEYAVGLKQFFTEYVERSGGSLSMFSTIHDNEALARFVGAKKEK